MNPRLLPRAATPGTVALPEAIVLVCAVLFLAASLVIPKDVFGGLAGYLPFHMFAETFSIVVSIAIFGLMWNSYRAEHSAGFLLLACAMLATGLLDFGHMLSVSRMPDFITPSSPDKGITFWLAARLAAAVGMVIAALWPETPLPGPASRHLALGVSLVTTAFVYWIGLFHQAWMPRFFVEGSGLTAGKVDAEYVLIAMLAVPTMVFFWRARRSRSIIDIALFAAAAISILSEMYFAVYAAPHDLFQVLGHAYKVIAYGFLYRAVYVTGVQDPLRELQLHAVQDGINTIFKEAVVCDTEAELGQTCLQVAEHITDSKFGFIADLNADGTLDVFAIGNPGWEACAMPSSEATKRLRNMPARGLFGAVVRKARSLVANDPSRHPESVGTPEGHPRLSSFMGVPLKQGEQIIGLIAVANREGGYTDSNQRDLEALSVAIVAAFMRKRAEQALRASEEKFAIAFANNAAAIALTRLDDGRFLEVNETLLALSGYTRAEMIGRSAREMSIWVDAEAGAHYLNELREKGTLRGRQQKLRNKSGEVLVAELSSELLTMRGEQVILSTFVDITERQRAEEQLRRQVEELREANEELARFNRVAVGRELRIIELKREINENCIETGRPPRYALDFEKETAASGPA